jgi:hypothetical protein
VTAIVVVGLAMGAAVAVSFTVSIAITLHRFHRSAREGPFDAATGTSPLRRSR